MPSFVDRVTRRDVSFVGEALAYGVASVAIVAASASGGPAQGDEARVPWMVLLAAGCIPALVILVVRLGRTYGRISTRCEACRERDAVGVRYLAVTGMVVLAGVRAVDARLCRRCSSDAYLQMTTHTAMFGWWSLTTLLTVPWVVLANTGVWLVHRTALRPSRVAVAIRWDGPTADARTPADERPRLRRKLRRRMIPIGALGGALAATLSCRAIVAIAQLARVDLAYYPLGVGRVAAPTLGSIATTSVLFGAMACIPALLVAGEEAATKWFAVIALSWTFVTVLPIGLPAGASGPAVAVFAVMYVVQHLVIACCILGIAADPPFVTNAP